jgi:hypothetical protein
MYGQPGQPGQQAFYPMMAQPSQVGQSYQVQPGLPQGGYVVQQQPGHSVVIQPGQNGQATVSQVPTQVSDGFVVVIRETLTRYVPVAYVRAQHK